MSKEWPDKTLVGLTGNIATGKSTVMRMAADAGALTIDADKIVHQLLDGDGELQAAVAAAFGPAVRRANGTIDRTALADIVFSNPERLRELERLVHPAVRRQIRKQIDDSDATVVFVEAIKLLEGGLAELVDQVWVTRTQRRTQIERLMVCRGMDAETAAMRVNAQPPQEAKVARADVVIDTDGTMESTREQFAIAWERLPAPGTAAPPERQTSTSRPVAATVEAIPQKPQARAETMAATPASPPDLLVRRARPSDVAAVLLLMQRATGGALQMKRADLLLALSERSYLIAQEGTEINMVVGWSTHSTTAVAIDQVYAYPPEAALSSGPAVLAEIEASARELICEVIFAYLPPDASPPVRQLFEQSGYRPMSSRDLRRAWAPVVSETQPASTALWGKILRDVRIR
ncbi:MAG: dephospho-CoA kinase [Chloroflexi bacterium]|nr:dephospho-CoA kinase [Chloroflexota bacterium]